MGEKPLDSRESKAIITVADLWFLFGFKTILIFHLKEVKSYQGIGVEGWPNISYLADLGSNLNS